MVLLLILGLVFVLGCKFAVVGEYVVLEVGVYVFHLFLIPRWLYLHKYFGIQCRII